jgi:type II secretory pathway pseudopilin PulG
LTQCGQCSGKFRRSGDQGYILLTLLLIIALMIIATAAVAPSIARQVQRDREEELIHRGMQYRRAIRQFTKHTGRYPTRLEELQYTNEARYLRRQYKDPITGGEFRLLHQSDILASGARLNTNTPSSDQSANGSADGASAVQPGVLGTGSGTSNDAGQTSTFAATSAAPESQNPQNPATSGFTGQAPPGDALSGGVIFGVVSKSTKTTIREFEHKNHYNQWFFFYSQIYDGSIEVKGPTPMTPVFPNPLPGSSNSPASSGQSSPGQSTSNQSTSGQTTSGQTGPTSQPPQ